MIFQPPRIPPLPFRRESSKAGRGGKRRNSHQSAVFGKAGNGTVAGISELVDGTGLEFLGPLCPTMRDFAGNALIATV